MLTTAYFTGNTNKSDDGLQLSYVLPGQQVEVLLWFLKTRPEQKQTVTDFLNEYFAKIERVESEDLEFLAEKLQEMNADMPMAVVAMENDTVMWAVLWGKVFFQRDQKRGYLTKDNARLALFVNKMVPDDRLVISLGDGLPADYVAGKSWNARGLGMLIVGTAQQPPQEVSVQAKKLSWKVFFKKTRKEPELYIKHEERAKLGKVVLVLFLILLISVGLGWQKRKSQLRQEAFRGIYDPTLNALVEAETAYSQNPLLARDKLTEARQSLAETLSAYEEGSDEHDKLLTLQGKIDQLYAKVSGEEHLNQPSVFFDLGLVKNGMQAAKIAFGDGWVVALDVLNGTLVGVDLETKNAKVLAGGDILSGASVVSASTGKAVILTQRGLVGVFFGERPPELLIEKDEQWQDPQLIGMFGGNVYVLDAQTNEIWLYPGFEGGLGERRRWLGPGVTPDLSQVVSLAVDGDIWLGLKEGDALHFRRGAPLNIVLSGLSKPLAEATAIGALYEDDLLAIFDKPNNRVLLFDKSGAYTKQYVWEGFSQVSDMVLIKDASAKKMLLLSAGSTIYQIPLE